MAREWRWCAGPWGHGNRRSRVRKFATEQPGIIRVNSHIPDVGRAERKTTDADIGVAGIDYVIAPATNEPGNRATRRICICKKSVPEIPVT